MQPMPHHVTRHRVKDSCSVRGPPTTPRFAAFEGRVERVPRHPFVARRELAEPTCKFIFVAIGVSHGRAAARAPQVRGPELDLGCRHQARLQAR